MRWMRGMLGAALVLAGCVPAEVQQRIRDYNEDGVYLFQRGDYRSAGESFQAALALQPEDVGLQYNLAQCYDRMGDAAKAEQFYQQCLQRDPHHAPCRHGLAVLMVRQERSADAVKMVEDWLAREPKRAAAYAEDGWLWHQCGDLPRAHARLQQALQIDPHDVRALTELALVYEKMHRPDRAVALYERALEVNPQQPDVARRVNELRSQGVTHPRPE